METGRPTQTVPPPARRYGPTAAHHHTEGPIRMKVCAEPGCPTLTTSSRCTQHERQTDRARGTRQARGYGRQHDQLRQQWAPLVATGLIQCWRCHLLIPAGTPWDLGHDDNDRTKYRGPEHANQCNRAAGGRASQQRRHP